MPSNSNNGRRTKSTSKIKTQNKNKRVSIKTSQTYVQYKEPSKVSPILVTLVIIGFIIMTILSILYFFMS